MNAIGKLWLLIWKNILLQRSHLVQPLILMITPAIFCPLFFAMRQIGETGYKPNGIAREPFLSSEASSQSNEMTIYYSPDIPLVNSIMNLVTAQSARNWKLNTVIEGSLLHTSCVYCANLVIYYSMRRLITCGGHLISLSLLICCSIQ